MGEPVRIPKHVLDELESVRRYTRVDVLDLPTLRYVAMETHKPALVTWIDRHAGDYGRVCSTVSARGISLLLRVGR